MLRTAKAVVFKPYAVVCRTAFEPARIFEPEIPIGTKSFRNEQLWEEEEGDREWTIIGVALLSELESEPVTVRSEAGSSRSKTGLVGEMEAVSIFPPGGPAGKGTRDGNEGDPENRVERSFEAARL